MRVDEAFERELKRLGLKLARTPHYDAYEISAVLTIPGSECFIGFNLSGSSVLSAGLAMTELLRHELHAHRDRLILAWHLESLRRENPELRLVERHQRCFECKGNVIAAIDRKARTYRCDGPAPATVHPWPEHCVIVRGGGLELVLPEVES